MKKKLASILLAVVCVFAIGFCALACSDDVDGTYYMWASGEKVSAVAYEFDDGDIKIKRVKVGEYKVDGDKVKITLTGQTSYEGTKVSDGVISLGGSAYFCKDGKKPPKN